VDICYYKSIDKRIKQILQGFVYTMVLQKKKKNKTQKSQDDNDNWDPIEILFFSIYNSNVKVNTLYS
jgi:hypothetical protein